MRYLLETGHKAENQAYTQLIIYNYESRDRPMIMNVGLTFIL